MTTHDTGSTTIRIQRSIAIKITPNDKGNPPGKLADAEIHFTDGPLEGMRLIGFAIWERRSGAGRNVTFPARQYSINGERRSYALLRPSGIATNAQDKIRDLVLEAYSEYESLEPVAQGTQNAAQYAAQAAGCTCPSYPTVIDRDCPIIAHHPTQQGNEREPEPAQEPAPQAPKAPAFDF